MSLVRSMQMEDMENRPPMAVGRSSSGKQSVDDQAISYSNAADGDLDEMHYATWNGVSYGPRVRSSSAGRGGIAIHANKIGVSKRSLVQDDISAHRLSEHPSSSLYRSRDHAYNPSTLRSLPFASDAVGDLIHVRVFFFLSFCFHFVFYFSPYFLIV